MKKTLYISRTMINGRAWDYEIFSSKPQITMTGDQDGMSIWYEGDRTCCMWNLEQLIPKMCPDKAGLFKVEIEDMEDGSYTIRRLKL